MKRNLAEISRRAASEGMVLLKNEDGALPLLKEESVALVGGGCFDYKKGGLGSANVTSAYTVDLLSGLEKFGANLNPESKEEKEVYDLGVCNRLAEKSDTAIVMITRNSGEGADCQPDWFYLSGAEKELLDTLEKSNFKKVAAILNISGIIDAASVAKYKKVKSVLIAWLPGMEGGNAVADVLYGAVTPSGKLTDTIAYEYSDYPSSSTFNASPCHVNYAEGIFVGYRYFETFKKDRVAYPFGFGLSYTSFEYEDVRCRTEDGKIKVSLKIRNTGRYFGAEIAEVYTSSPKGGLPKPEAELRAFCKTKVLKPEESETVEMAFDARDMAYFDESRAAYILDSGVYSVYVGKNVRELMLAGEYEEKEEREVFSTTLKFSHGLPYGINKDGKIEQTRYWDSIPERSPAVLTASNRDEILSTIVCKNELSAEERADNLSLCDVEEGKLSLSEFIKGMTAEELIEISMGQPPALVRGTAGIGNVASLGIVNAQTGDGPAGVRSTKPTICFPCATLLASAWNENLLFKVGEALGADSIENGVDILLAPGLNIHRNPLCGRNFEYYSEDPVVSGKTAAAIVRGVQKMGVGSAVKHFALNNKEENRKDSDSNITERALREIYLKGFEIAVKEGSPWCVMTSYNMINGKRASANAALIKGILREEWGYEGLVMTDWRVKSHLWEEIKAGSNVKMPGGYPEEIELAKTVYSQNILTRAELENSAEYILKTVMKTRRNKEKNFGVTQDVGNFNVLDFLSVSTTWSGTSLEADGETSLSFVGLDRRGMEVFVDYRIKNETCGIFTARVTASMLHEGQSAEIYLDGKKVGEITFDAPRFGLSEFFDFESNSFEIGCGIHGIRVFFHGAKELDSAHYKKWEFAII